MLPGGEDAKGAPHARGDNTALGDSHPGRPSKGGPANACQLGAHFPGSAHLESTFTESVVVTSLYMISAR